MYELLLGADVVVADLSTSNANAIYELGVRHALRPNTTIVIAERNFKFPSDITHLVIRPYTHLGPGIDAEDAEAARESLKTAIHELTEKDHCRGPRELDGRIPGRTARQAGAATNQSTVVMLPSFASSGSIL